ncbi:MAG: hypothetical protein FWC06_00665 [Treponema sp.]|nr:hypothetical protein [Treponema sp.]
MYIKKPFVLLCAPLWLILFLLGIAACERKNAENIPVQSLVTWSGAYPAAILQTGEYPLWFQLTENGPVHIAFAEEALFSRDLVPWPYALHIRYMEERDGGIVMAVNRYGFLKLGPENASLGSGLPLYCFYGGNYWSEYTVGGLVFYEGEPAALVYPDDRFLDSASTLLNGKSPVSVIWSFNMNSNVPYPLDIPALQFFPQDDGWAIDTLRQGSDGFFHYRAVKRNDPFPEIRTLRTANLSQAGEETSIEIFYDSFPRDSGITVNPRLPELPEGFAYTGTGYASDSLFASWEEQIDYSIGAAGFVIIKP